jgi:hypothetical protein
MIRFNWNPVAWRTAVGGSIGRMKGTQIGASDCGTFHQVYTIRAVRDGTYAERYGLWMYLYIK